MFFIGNSQLTIEEDANYNIWTRLCHGSYEKSFKQYLDLQSLVPYLYEEDLIDHQSKIADEEWSTSDRISYLLNLLKKGGPESCGKFIYALEKEDEHLGHQYVLHLMMERTYADNDEIALSSRLRKRTKDSDITNQLLTNMSLETVLAWHMYTEKLVTYDDLIMLRSSPTYRERNKMVLQILNTKGPLAYLKFIYCLKKDSEQVSNFKLFRQICNNRSVETEVTSMYQKGKSRESQEISVPKRVPIPLEIDGELVKDKYRRVIKGICLLHSMGKWGQIDRIVAGCEKVSTDVYVAILLESCFGLIIHKDYHKIEERIGEARELCSKITNNCSIILLGRCEAMLAHLFHRMRERDKAREHIIMARHIQNNTRAGEDTALCNYWYASILMESLANRFNLYEYEEARRCLELSIDHATSGDFGLDVANHRIRLAQLYLGSTPKSPGTRTDKDSLKRALSSLNAVNHNNIGLRTQCVYYYTESDLYRNSGEIEKAKHSAQKALDIAMMCKFETGIKMINKRIDSLVIMTHRKLD